MRAGILIISTFLIFGLRCIAGADNIFYNGVQYQLCGYPLQFNPEFRQWNVQSVFGEDAEIQELFDAAPYSCNWIVRDSHIYLQSIKNDTLTANLKAIFPGKYDNGLVLADWIDTTLYAPYGKRLYSWGVSFNESTFEYELAFKISKGKIISVEKYDNTKTKPLKDGGHLKGLIQNSINWENLPEQDSIKRKVYVQVISANSLGKIDSVRIVRGVNEFYNREAVRIVKTIPEWPVIYRHGKVLNLLTFPIVFERPE